MTQPERWCPVRGHPENDGTPRVTGFREWAILGSNQ